MTTIAELEERIAALEVQDEAGSPNYLTVDPADFSVGAVFPGGVQMLEQTTLQFGPNSTLSWLNPATRGVREWITGAAGAAPHHLLILRSQPDANDVAQLTLSSDEGGGAGSGFVTAQAQDSVGVSTAVTVTDSLNRSTFPQSTNPTVEKILYGDPATIYLGTGFNCPGATWFNYLPGPPYAVVYSDPGGRWNAGAGGYQCRNSGIFLVSGSFAYNPGALVEWAVGFTNNVSGAALATSGASPAAVGAAGGSFSVITPASAGDVLIPQAWTNVVAAIQVAGNGGREATWFSVMQIR
jgi:hypothetical protein